LVSVSVSTTVAEPLSEASVDREDVGPSVRVAVRDGECDGADCDAEYVADSARESDQEELNPLVGDVEWDSDASSENVFDDVTENDAE
jgi:Fe-S cluster assembly iron-binding protein IscA